MRCDGYRFTRGRKLSIPVGKALQKKYGLSEQRLSLRWKGKCRWSGKQGRLEIVHDRLSSRWYAKQPVEVAEPPHQPKGDRRAYVDLNMRNLLVVRTEGVLLPKIYRANHLLSDWLYWERRIAEHQSELKKVNGLSSSRQLRKLYRLRQRRLHHGVNKLVREMVAWCWRVGVSVIYIDDPLHSREGVRWHRKSSKLLHNFWCYRYLVERLTLVAEEHGMAVVPDRASSCRCSLCGGDRESTGCHRKHRGLFVCKTHNMAVNADVNATWNFDSSIVPSPPTDRDNRAMVRPAAVYAFA